MVMSRSTISCRRSVGLGDLCELLQELGYQKTTHFACRQVQRGVRDEIVLLALRFGRKFYDKGGEQVYFLGRKQLPRDLAPKIAERANGTTVVVGANGALITTFRNPEFSKVLKRRN